MAEYGFGAAAERVVDRAAAAAVESARRVQARLGPRPAGFEEVPAAVQLAEYLTWRSDPAAWSERIALWAGGDDRGAGYAIAVREATRLERALLRRGNWDGTAEDAPRATAAGMRAVQVAQAARAVARSQRAAAAVAVAAGRPKALVTPDLPVTSVLDLLAGMEG